MPPPSALCMANPKTKSASNRQGRSRSLSAVASSSATKRNDNHNADTSDDSDQTKNKKKQQPKTKKKKKNEANTGRLRLLPSLQPSTEILSRAQRQTHNEIKDDLKIANARRRTQKRGAQTIDLLSQKLCSPLKTTVQTYRWELKRMHPFEKVVMELTVRARQKKDGLTLTTLLEEVHEGRKELLQLSKDWISKIKTAPTAREAYECTEEAKGIIGKVFLDLIEEPWAGVMELQKSLRNVPIVRLDCPAVVLVGAPNVGKSSIVRAISSGTPEVNNYPFTTRGMTLGHVQVFWESDRDVAVGNVAGVSIPSEKQLVQERLLKRGVKSRRMAEKEALEKYSREKEDAKKDDEEESGIEVMGDAASSAIESGGNEKREHNLHNGNAMPAKNNKPDFSNKIFPISQLCQIMDSPGILRRDEADLRNEMEELTLAAMAHLPTAVMYVMDLSGGAGDKCSSVEDQLVLRRELKARFPRRPWIDVISKVDLGIVDGAGERLVQILDAEREQRGGDVAADQPYITLSVKEGQGVDELRQEVMRMLGEVRVVLDAMAAMDERSARAV
eukprot:CAMPEP_0181117800 /NCGR_PEP_ID=MMETSP1071-20121207/22731_1 /TAXON_ID=35127 /ORGANISM="Thalassiosira sp., Strain NH16" /LENGTH=558 /DNA_ID=CAMNT_0023202243 /DNA_START=477 /DNA_END=2153 /DNA_ORIENTATION=+